MRYFRVFLSLLALVSCVALAKPPKHLQLSAGDILDRQEELAELWPGYWAEGQGFVLYDDEGAALVVARDCAELGLTAFDDDEGMALCEYQVPPSAGVTRFVQLFTFGKQTLPGARQSYLVDKYNAIWNLFWQRALQVRDSWQLAAERGQGDLGELSAQMIADMHLEKELLVRALEPSRRQEAEQALYRFLAARIERHKSMRPEQIAYQNQAEWRESFPHWVAYLALSEVADFSQERLNASYASVLKVPPNRYLELAYVFDISIYRLNGAVMLELMRRLKLDFYAPFEAGFSPYEILSYAYDTTTMDSAALVNTVAPPDYREAILLKAEQALEGQRDVASLAAEFSQKGKYHLVFKETGIVNVEYDPFFHSVLPDGTYLYRRSLRTLIDAPSYSAELDGGWQRMLTSIEDYPGSVVQMPIDELPDFAECPGVEHKICAKGTSLRGDGFKLKIKTEVKITVAGRQVLVEPLIASAEHPQGFYTSPGRP